MSGHRVQTIGAEQRSNRSGIFGNMPAMDIVIASVLAAAFGCVIGLLLRGKTENPAAQSAPESPAAPASADVGEQVRELAQKLESTIESLAQPTEALELEDFKAGVALLSDSTVPVDQVSGYATGANWVASCLAAEALAARDDGASAVDAVLRHLQHLYAWPLVFALRFLDKHYDGPLVGRAMVSAQHWWSDNVSMTRALEQLARTRRERGADLTFGDSLKSVKDASAVADLLAALDDDLFAGMRQEFGKWRRTRVNTRLLTSLGSFIATNTSDRFAPRSDRLTRYVQRMLDAQSPGAARSVLLVGEAGVGCEAIALDFARDLGEQGWRSLETSAAAIVAGKKYVGEIEEQVRKLIANAAADKNIAIHIRNFHELVAAGTYKGKREGVLDQMLPAIEKGRILLIGHTTPGAYQKLVLRQPRLAVALEAIRVEPADDQESTKLARDFLLWSKSCQSEESASKLAAESVQLTKQYLPTAAAPGSVLRLLDLIAQARESAGETDTEVTRDDILLSLSRATGLPLDVLDENQSLDIAALTGEFEKRVIGQPDAVSCLVERIAMLKAGLTDTARPVGVFLFAGPTGTGKTEIAKALAEILFGDRDRMIRLDMSEFQRSESLSKILGDDGDATDNSLIARIRRQPFSVVLLDEFEKAHARVWDLFLQVFDDGRLSDAAGNTASFRHAFIILTSNLGATISEQPGMGFTSSAGGFSRSDVMRAIERSFRKEFVNRLDRVVVFNPLSREVMRLILNKELKLALGRRGFRHREWAVEWEDTAVDFLLDKGFTLDMGARPLRRAIEQYFLAPLSMTIVENRFPSGDQFLFVRADGEGLSASFVDPDGGPDATTPPADGSSIRSIALHGAGGAGARSVVLVAADDIAGRLDGPQWQSTKSDELTRINSDGFWDDPKRHEALDRLEFRDRIESAAAAVKRLAGRVRSTSPSRELNRQLAHKIYLLETALSDLDADRPRHAFLEVEAQSDGDELTERAWTALRDMYQGWARRRGMRTSVLSHDSSAAHSSWLISVTGFGAYSILAHERGLHVFDYSTGDGAGTERVRATVNVAAQSPIPERNRAKFLKRAREALRKEKPTQPGIVRRYDCLASPLVRDRAGGWRTGRLDLVLQGDFDLFEV